MRTITTRQTRLKTLDVLLAKATGKVLDLRAKELYLEKQICKDYSTVIFGNSFFNYVTFVKCTFEYCSFTGVNFRDCTFENCSFKNCSFIGANFVEIKESRDNTFMNCDFRASFFSKSYLFRTTFFDCDFRTAEIKDCDFRESLLPEGFAGENTLTNDCTFSNEAANQTPLNF